MKRYVKIASVLVVVGSVMLTTSALAQYYSPSPPTFPTGWYIGPPQPFTFESPALTQAGIASIYLSSLVHTPAYVPLTSYYDGAGNWVETFNSTLTGTATINLLVGGPIVGTLSAGGATPVTVTTPGNSPPGGAVGNWPGQSMTILNWPATVTYGTNHISIWIECSNAPGESEIKLAPPGSGVPAGWYEADSFFDVWPEISLDDSLWTYSDQSGDMTLVPEPSSLALLGLGVLCLAIKTRRGPK